MSLYIGVYVCKYVAKKYIEKKESGSNTSEW